MRCTDFEAKLNELLDQGRSLKSDAELCQHARECPACSDLAAAYSQLRLATQKLAEPEPSPEFSVAVLQSFNASRRVEIQRRRTGRRRALMGLVAVAAALVLAITLRPKPLPEVAAPIAKVEAQAKAPVDLPATDTDETGAAQAVFVLTDQYEVFVRETDSTVRHMEWVGEVAEGFRPLGQSLYSALNAIRRTLPINSGERERSSQTYRSTPAIA